MYLMPEGQNIYSIPIAGIAFQMITSAKNNRWYIFDSSLNEGSRDAHNALKGCKIFLIKYELPPDIHFWL